MKKQLAAYILAAALVSSIPVLAEETAETDNLPSPDVVSPWKISAVTDFAWYPKSAYVAGTDHYAPFTGWYSGLQARTTLNASYKIPVPFGTNPLVAGNNVTVAGSLEITPVSLMPGISVSFSPIAFLNFSAGSLAGSGWDLMGMHGIAQYNAATGTYDTLSAFSSWYLREWLSGTFMFDTAAVWPGDWHHIVAVATYEARYVALTGSTSTIWEWQTTKGFANGWQQYQSYVLGYQMPIPLSLAGIRVECTGYYDASVFGKYADSFCGNFTTVDISPLVQLTFGKHDTLFVMANFESRRSFTTAHTMPSEEPALQYTGAEWFFNRIALSWTHTF